MDALIVTVNINQVTPHEQDLIQWLALLKSMPFAKPRGWGGKDAGWPFRLRILWRFPPWLAKNRGTRLLTTCKPVVGLGLIKLDLLVVVTTSALLCPIDLASYVDYPFWFVTMINQHFPTIINHYSATKYSNIDLLTQVPSAVSIPTYPVLCGLSLMFASLMFGRCGGSHQCSNSKVANHLRETLVVYISWVLCIS